jgi:predicted transcriptional regulator
MKDHVAEIVAAYLRRNTVTAGDVPAVITQVYQALAGLGQAQSPAPEPAALKPAVPIRRSVSADSIVCLECGYKAKMLRRHLTSAHQLEPEDYRQRWNLPADYPLVAPDYSARRSALAKSVGLGKRATPRRPKRAPAQ